ncbi:MAG: hypothetical protein JJP05_02385 [cyanobacterium endosymbiont of Rhopalodia gibba]
MNSHDLAVNGFSFSHSFRYCRSIGFENWTLPLPSALRVRVAPVESLHLPRKFRGLAQDCLICIPDLGFPEFESDHLIDFSNKAQLC